MQKITPFPWFDTPAEEAVSFISPSARRVAMRRYASLLRMMSAHPSKTFSDFLRFVIRFSHSTPNSLHPQLIPFCSVVFSSEDEPALFLPGISAP
jgi:hypothetical protein